VPELDDRRIEALDLLDSLANDPRFALNMHFRPGDIQFLNNYKIWHARTSYVDYPEPARQRDLYRLWLTLRVPMHLPDDFRIGGITDREVAFG
jgi:alpha-ketoglutarate-dependent taurine dioxygenase